MSEQMILNSEISLADSSAVIPRKPLINAKGFPYLPARLTASGTDGWYIIYRVWDTGLEQLVRRRVLTGDLAEIKDLSERKKFASEIIEEINTVLSEGGHQHTEPETIAQIQDFNFRSLTLLDAIDQVKAIKVSEGKVADPFRKLNNSVKEFLSHLNVSTSFPLLKVDRTFVNQYLAYLTGVRKIANNTRNNYIGNFHTAIETLRNLDDKLWPIRNPLHAVPKLRHKEKRNRAYSQEQMLQFEKTIAKADPQLWLFIRFAYYTLARPKKEIRFFKVGDIDLVARTIYLRPRHSKTNGRWIHINASLQSIIEASGIMTFPKDHYVFSLKGTPGIEATGKNYFYKRFSSCLKNLGLSKSDYTLYSCAHSGAVALYLATKDAYLVQQQKGHTTLSQTLKYLRDLGLFVDKAQLDKWSGV